MAGAFLIGAALAFASGQSDFEVMHYRDADGMRVTTSEAGLEQGVAPGWLLTARILWDRIAMEGGSGDSTGMGHEHHMMKQSASEHGGMSEIDGTSGASQRASTAGGGAVQQRYQVDLGLAHQIGHGSTPHRIGGKVAVSYEDDYLSTTAIADASMELFQRNVTLSGHAGFGYDRIDPVVPPPGEADEWPAGQQRYLLGFGLTQVTGRRSTVSAGYGMQLQVGSLESPYRRALVVTTRFAERLPDLRVRHHAALSWSYTPLRRLGLHHREGVYYDSWNYHAWIPETAVSWEAGAGLMLTLRHRFVSQDAAEFWQHHYTSLAGYRSGDFRLAGMRHQAATLEVSWRHEIGYRMLELGGHATAFEQNSKASGVHAEGLILGASAAWAW